MRAKLYSRFQRVKTSSLTIVLIVLLTLVIVLISLSILGYIFNWDWTGLGPYIGPRTTGNGFQREKTLWDWMQLLIIPIVLAISGYLFSSTINKNERKAADQRNQTEREIAQDNQRETALQEYIDKISELLLHENLRKSQARDEVQIIARVRTLTTLSRLDKVRKSILLKFLYESNLINGNEDNTFINLQDADFCEVDLTGQHLVGINLAGAKLTRAILRGANLTDAILKGIDLKGADLKHSYLNNTNFGPLAITTTKINDIPVRHLRCANLAETNLEGADLENAYMHSTNLVKANILQANIKDVTFWGACIDHMTCSSAQSSDILSKIEEEYA